MKKIFFKTLLLFLFILILILNVDAGFKSNIIDKVAITNNEIPTGFVLGKIPGFAKKTLRSNPWLFDSKAIRKLTGRIYPGGDFKYVSNIHTHI